MMVFSIIQDLLIKYWCNCSFNTYFYNGWPTNFTPELNRKNRISYIWIRFRHHDRAKMLWYISFKCFELGFMVFIHSQFVNFCDPCTIEWSTQRLGRHDLFLRLWSQSEGFGGNRTVPSHDNIVTYCRIPLIVMTFPSYFWLYKWFKNLKKSLSCKID